MASSQLPGTAGRRKVNIIVYRSILGNKYAYLSLKPKAF
jgi:hypothetical protein